MIYTELINSMHREMFALSSRTFVCTNNICAYESVNIRVNKVYVVKNDNFYVIITLIRFAIK